MAAGSRNRRRGFTIGALVGLVLAALVGGIWWWWSSGDPPDDPTLQPRAIDLADLDTFVALGDSYSAGEGLRPFDADAVDVRQGGDGCHRSASAFPRRLLFVDDVDMRHRACSGAHVEHLYDKVQEHDDRAVSLGLQADGQLDGDVGLVTVTVGGNDASFAQVVKFCAFRSSCLDDPFDGRPSLTAWSEEALAALATELPVAYRRLDEDAPAARIVVIGYPKLFAARATRASECFFYRNFFDNAERDELNRLILRMNRVIEQAAITSGAEYVDVSYVFEGHETCGAAGPWLQFLGQDLSDQDGNFHPNVIGQRMIARTLACYLTIVDRPPDGDPGAGGASSTVPAPDTPDEDLQQPDTDRPSGDLGDAVYDCAAGRQTTGEPDRGDPEIIPAQSYEAPADDDADDDD